MFEAAKRRLAGDRISMVGDALDADIAGGARAGLATILVLGGRTAAADREQAGFQPDTWSPTSRALRRERRARGSHSSPPDPRLELASP